MLDRLDRQVNVEARGCRKRPAVSPDRQRAVGPAVLVEAFDAPLEGVQDGVHAVQEVQVFIELLDGFPAGVPRA